MEAPADLSTDALLRLGAKPLVGDGDGGVRFSLFSDVARTAAVQLHERPGVLGTRHALERGPEGLWSATVLGVGPGALYNFVLDDRELPDPFALWLPHGVHGPAAVFASRYQWRHPPRVSRPLREQVFYELHVGTFTGEGTYRAAALHLPELAALGVTAVELMPVAAFAGRRGWGYDGVALYAPHAPYGSPDELRAFVDEAHAHGLSVFLDVVYNHFGPAGNYLAAYSPSYFTSEVRNAWGDAPNFAHPMVRRYVLDNALYWLEEFRFDGLRLDATHAVVDRSPRHILRELADLVAERAPGKLLVAEDEHNDPQRVEEWRLNGLWADDFHHQVRVTLTGESDGYYSAYRGGAAELAETIRGGWRYQGEVYPPTGRPRGQPAPHLPAEAFLYCIQNHDQVGNRATGERLSHAVDPESYRAVSTLLLFLPMTPILFMGQEWAASTPFLFFTDHDPELGKLIAEGRRREFAGFRAFQDPAVRERIPDPQDEQTFLRSRLRWDERESGEHGRVLQLYRALLRLRREDPVLRAAGREALEASARGGLLTVRRWHAGQERRLLLNLGVEPIAIEGEVLLRSDGRPDQRTLPPRTAAITAARAS